MNRRGFLAFLGTAPVTAPLAAKRALASDLLVIGADVQRNGAAIGVDQYIRRYGLDHRFALRQIEAHDRALDALFLFPVGQVRPDGEAGGPGERTRSGRPGSDFAAAAIPSPCRPSVSGTEDALPSVSSLTSPGRSSGLPGSLGSHPSSALTRPARQSPRVPACTRPAAPLLPPRRIDVRHL